MYKIHLRGKKTDPMAVVFAFLLLMFQRPCAHLCCDRIQQHVCTDPAGSVQSRVHVYVVGES